VADPEDFATDTKVVTLRDGQRIRVRPVRPSDKAAIQAGLERMSPQSRYRRFFSAVDRLSPAQLAYFTELDYVDHFAWVALAMDEPGEPGVGVARYIRDRDDPTAAHVAVAVVDDWQGRGVGTILLEGLALVASQHGIERFVGEVLAENAPMLKLTRDVGGRSSFGGGGVREIEIEVPAAAGHLRDSPLFDLFRQAACHPDPAGDSPPR
jgi:GNAT superfamily N-acetyltransferase